MSEPQCSCKWWTAGVAAGAVIGILLVRSQKRISIGPIPVQDLLDPEIRDKHIDWNQQVHSLSRESAALEVGGIEEPTYVVPGYYRVRELLQEPRMSSNPYADERLIALNTMAKPRHAVVAKLLNRFYRYRDIRRISDEFLKTAETLCEPCLSGDRLDVMTWARRVHMSNTLKVLLGPPRAARRTALIDPLIQFNDDMVKLVAPLGGVGLPCPPLFSAATPRMLYHLCLALPDTLRFLQRAGLAGLEITRPDLTLGRGRQGSGVWRFPELLQQVPKYFMLLMDLFDESPTPNQEDAATCPIEALKFAVTAGEVTLAEALVTIVQLMVNMTSANAIGNLVHRLATEKSPECKDAELEAFVSEVLRLDAPLQRNPRRVTEPISMGTTTLPAGAQVLLLLGAANTDPVVFPDPTAFQPGRLAPEDQGVTFGAGPHYCLGASLVKLEMREVARLLLRDFDRLEVQENRRVRDVDVGNYGFESLVVKAKRRWVKAETL
eukprot:CAMPEP_0204374768 /NCGR_PEP_ID=MMETSP0469-20131031/48832_1 /ASSEMBLY_ACC=CAM_ASM_000384 /TAXON_ID=2969 /ORGANISM="Oxyrrhis marina" /LENGTH=492 /DNA_ID=CAMNT_0051365377 /DNA_START=7 /DNA_END=1485 /DNA_ORIENTATION=-